MRKLLLVFFLFLPRILHAEENPLGLSFFGSFFHSENVPNALFFFADIERNDSFELRRALRTHEIDTIVLLSDGGSVWEGLNLAGIIYDNALTTYVPQIRDDLGCYSACAFMFFAGQTRLVEGELGVHQVGAYDNELDAQQQALGEVQQSTQFTTSEIIGFLNEFETPPWVYERMFRSRELYIFTAAERLELNNGELNSSDKRAIDYFLSRLQEQVRNSLVQNEPQADSPIFADVRDLRIAIQSELNRLGCSLGRPDGVIGARSRLALTAFLEEVDLNIAIDTSLFESEDFYTYLKELPAPICLGSQDLTEMLQRELQRVGCYSGGLDGILGPMSIAAKRAVTIELGLSSVVTDEALLTALRETDEQLCRRPIEVPRPQQLALAPRYELVVTCGNRSWAHWLHLSSPNLTGWNRTTVPNDVRYSFVIENRGRGAYGLCGGPLCLWRFSGWISQVGAEQIRFQPNDYATEYDQRPANFEGVYRISSNGIYGVDRLGCNVRADPK